MGAGCPARSPASPTEPLRAAPSMAPGRALLPAALLALALGPGPAAALPCIADCPPGEGRAGLGRDVRGVRGSARGDRVFSARRYVPSERGLRAVGSQRGLPALPGRHLLQHGGTRPLQDVPAVPRYRQPRWDLPSPGRHLPG